MYLAGLSQAARPAPTPKTSAKAVLLLTERPSFLCGSFVKSVISLVLLEGQQRPARGLKMHS